MLSPELLAEVLKKTLSNGGDYADVFVEWKRPTFLYLDDDRLEKVISGVDFGVGIRLISDGKTAYAYSNDAGKEALLDAAGALGQAARAGTVRDFNLKTTAGDINLKALIRPPAPEGLLKPEEVPMEKKTALVQAANRTARAVDKRIKQVSVTYRDLVQRVAIATTEGGFTEEERIYSLLAVNVMAEQDNTIQTSFEIAGGLLGFELFEHTDPEEMALTAAKRALMMLGAQRAPGGRMPVVISSEAGGTMVHEAIGHGLEADLAGQGLSAFSGKMGQQVASPLVTVVDDATLPGKRGSFAFDDEGTPAQKTVLVQDGVMAGCIYDRLNAMREGAACTGNGRRQSYEYRPIPRMTNTFIAPGASSPEEVLRATQSGLFVKKMGGGQVNTVTGEFVFDVLEGYLIESGSLGELVRGATLVGSGPEVLMSIDMVGSDLGFEIGTCGKDSQGVPVSDASPTIRIPEMVVGGEVAPK